MQEEEVAVQEEVERRRWGVAREGREGELPAPPLHLPFPLHLVAQEEHLHPLQPAPTPIRTFVCGKLFRRDEVRPHGGRRGLGIPSWNKK